jgi:Phosphotransferase enzyme family
MEQHLPGGLVTAAVRIGDTVHRRPSPNAGFVHDLLAHLERHGWDGAPRYLGMDAEGREVLSFLEGHVAWASAQPAAVHADQSLAGVAQLVRRFHDLTAGTPLAGGAEVVCHNDLSPRNTVYRDDGAGLRPVAFIDWDLAAPGDRLHDVAHACWQFLPLGPSATDLTATARRLRLVCDSYGLEDRGRLVDTILWWQDRCWRGIEAGAAAGDPAMRRLRDHGGAAAVRADHAWVTARRARLEAALA